jgi:predicted amidohydrolase
MKDIRIAAVVCRCPVGQVKRNLARTRYWTLRARKKGAAWSAFPEFNLTGYSNREEIADHAISAHGSEIDALIVWQPISKSLCWWDLRKKIRW